MKINMTCLHCVVESEMEHMESVDLEISDDGKYEFVCSKGHQNVVYSDTNKYQVLFEIGINALLDGYRQEAISCCASALERFHEWCILVILRKNQITYEDFLKTWNTVKRQSERQLGAFYFLYLMEFKEAPKSLDLNKVAFRNNVIHNGYLPNYEETYDYIKYIYEYIGTLQKVIYNKYRDSINDVSHHNLSNLRDKYGQNSTTTTIATILNVFVFSDENKIPEFEKVIKFISRHKVKLDTVK